MNDPSVLPQTSLDRLQDILVPPAIPWWPPAVGWYGLAILVLVLILWRVWTAARRRHANRYRREALAQLKRLDDRLAHSRPGDESGVAETLDELAVLLKRTALTAYPRRQVAGLSGERWWQFLDSTGGNGEFSHGLGRKLERAIYRSAERSSITPQVGRRLMHASAHWVQCHPGQIGHRLMDDLNSMEGPG